MPPTVSIIIPVYNSEKYLAETIQSAISQTWPDKEIIIVDDGSTDNSLTLAKTFQSEFVHVFHQENKGASSARNKGLQEATGEYIQFLDADDLLSPDKIEEQVKLLNKHPGYICFCPTVNFTDDEDYSKKNIEHHWIKDRSDDPVDFLIKLYGGALIGPQYGGLVAVHAWLCPRYILDKAGSWNAGLTLDDDGEYFCRVILCSKGIVYAPNGINYYRKHTQHSSLSALRTETGYQSLINSIDLKFKHLHQASKNKQIVNKVFARIYNDFAVNTYPRFKKYSDYARAQAKSLWALKPEYNAGPVSNILVKILGWRLVRTLNYYRHGL